MADQATFRIWRGSEGKRERFHIRLGGCVVEGERLGYGAHVFTESVDGRQGADGV